MAKTTSRCPACGAPLNLTAGRTRCEYCGSEIAVTAPPGGLQPGEPTPQVARPAGTRQRTLLVFLSAGVLLIAGVVLMLVLLLRQGGEEQPAPTPPPTVSRRAVHNPAILLSVDRPGPADLLVFNYDYDSDPGRHVLSYLDGLDRSLRWDSPELSSQADLEGLVVSSLLIYVTDQDRLVAINRGDGTLAWEARMSDSVLYTSCDHCLQRVGQHVIVLSQDGMLQAWEATSGRPAWSVRLHETPRNLWTVNGLVAVLDVDPAEYRSRFLQLRDPASGQVVREMQATCTVGDYTTAISVYDATILVSDEGDALYLLYGSHPGCAQRWDPVSCQLVWQTATKDDHFDHPERPPFMADGVLYVGSDSRLLALETQGGTMQVLLDEPDYEVIPLAARDGVVLVRARRTRGSERDELWALDAASGQRKWQRLLGEEELLGESGSAHSDAWSWHLAAQGLLLLHLRQEPGQLEVETLDLQTGQRSSLATIELDGDSHSWHGLTWSDSTFWLAAQDLYAVDLGAGQVLWRWP